MTDTTNPGVAAPVADADKTVATAATDSQAATEPAKVEGQGDAEAVKEGEPAAAAEDKSDDAAAPVVPDKYEVPDLGDYKLEGPRLEYAEKISREAGFTQEQFAASAKAYVELQEQAREYETAAWGKQSEVEFGKDYATITTSAQTAVRALEAERPGLLETFDSLGWGNHPDALWLFSKVGSLLREGTVEGLENPGNSPAPRDIRAELYPNDVRK